MQQSNLIGRKVSVDEAMSLAIFQGRKGLGFVAPNPAVGCVILDQQQRIISTGYHHLCGADHAEVDALNNLSDKSLLNGAHVVVTLEPCAHQGRTPSCAKALAELPIGKVTYGLLDPHPLVSGKGVEILKASGKQVVEYQGSSKGDLLDLTEAFFYNVLHNKTFVALKVATSLDGQMAMKTGESQWITGSEARSYGHRLRGQFDAVAVGVGTLLADDPQLNSRHPDFLKKSNQVVILDPKGESISQLLGRQVAAVRAMDKITVVVDKSLALDDVKIPEGLNILRIRVGASGFDIKSLLSELYNRGICSLFLEGGQGLYSSFLQAREVQRLFVFVAAKIIGSGSGLSWTRDFSVTSLSESLTLQRTQVVPFSNGDLLFSGSI